MIRTCSAIQDYLWPAFTPLGSVIQWTALSFEYAYINRHGQGMSSLIP